VPQAWRADLWQLIRQTPRLDWQLLTKRPQNIKMMLPPDWGDGWPNVWLGTTCESQEYFDQRWLILRRIPARVYFISYEPALGGLRLPRRGLLPDWLIAGGESGRVRRPCEPQWLRDIAADCEQRCVALFVKQWGGYDNNPLVREDGLSIAQAKIADPHGKGGALLDGVLIHEYPR
jgi:protein gp37